MDNTEFKLIHKNIILKPNIFTIKNKGSGKLLVDKILDDGNFVVSRKSSERVTNKLLFIIMRKIQSTVYIAG